MVSRKCLGSSFNAASIDVSAFDIGRHSLYTTTISGGIGISGTSNVGVLHFPDVSGGATLGGGDTWIQAHMVDVSGGINFGTNSADVHKTAYVVPAGGVSISGDSEYVFIQTTQIMHTDRVAVLLTYDTELFVEDLFNEATVVKTEDRLVDVPYIREFYS